ncbi:MAG TPA: peroxiredoxin [Myxococcota bacterium]|nr:peroxiredoxin [Myxococcota bacterium]
MTRLRLCALALALVAAPALGRAAELKPGDPAPDFALQSSDGRTLRLTDYVGKKGFVLAWFPKAFTSGCTEELGSLRDAQPELARYDVDVFMVSMDAPDKNAEFAKSLKAGVVLLSDPKGEVASAYGVSGLGGMYAKRWTFYVDKDGSVRFVDRAVKTATAGADIAAKLGELGFPKR